MQKDILEIDLPEKYQEGVIEYHPTFDGVDPFFLKIQGMGENRIKKMLLLYEIERMKDLIREPNDFTQEELEYGKKRIAAVIERYNSIKLN